MHLEGTTASADAIVLTSCGDEQALSQRACCRQSCVMRC